MLNRDWTELAAVLVPGILQCAFAAKVCARNRLWRALVLYEAGLVLILLAGSYLPDGSDLLLQGVLLTCIVHFVLGAPLRISVAAGILALTLTWIAFGIADSAVSLLQPSFGTPLPTWPSVIQTAAGIGINFAANMGALHLLRFRDGQNLPRVILLVLPMLFVLSIEVVAARYVYTTVSTGPDAPPAELHGAMLAVQTIGMGALMCTLAAYRYLLRSVQNDARIQSLEQARRAQRARLQ